MRRFAAILAAVVAVICAASYTFAQYPGVAGQPPNGLLFPSGFIPAAGATTASSCLQSNSSSTQLIFGSCGGSSSYPNGNAPQIGGYSGLNAGEAETVSGDCTFARLGANSYGITCNGIHGTPFPTATLAGNILIDQGSASPFADVTMGGDCTITGAGTITCLKVNGAVFGQLATASAPLIVALGGVGTASLTSNSLLVGKGTGAVAEVTPTLAGNFVVDQGSASPFADVAMGGDCTVTGTGAITCLKSNGTAFAAGAFAALPLTVGNGGSGVSNPIKNAILMGNGSSAMASITPTIAGNFIVDQGSASPFADVTMSGDCTVTGAGAITCLKSNGTAFAGAAFVGVPVTVPNGGVGTANLTSNSILLGNGTSAVAEVTPTLAGNIVLDQGSASPYADVTMSQDCTITKAGVITCTKTNNVAFGNLATAADPLVVAHGGSGASTFPTEGVIVAQGNAAAMVAITAGPTGAPFVSNGGAATPIYTAELTIGVGGTSAQSVSAWPIATTNAQTTATAQIVLGPATGFWSTNQEITMSPAATITVTFLLSTPAFANQIEQFKICESANHGNIGLPTFSPTAGMTITGSYPVCTPGAGLCCDMQIYYDTTTTAYITGSNSGPL